MLALCSARVRGTLQTLSCVGLPPSFLKNYNRVRFIGSTSSHICFRIGKAYYPPPQGYKKMLFFIKLLYYCPRCEGYSARGTAREARRAVRGARGAERLFRALQHIEQHSKWENEQHRNKRHDNLLTVYPRATK